MKSKILIFYNELRELLDSEHKNVNLLINAIESMVDVYNNDKKILVCGNGGSAADSQHFVAELVGRYKLERKAYNAVALTTDTSILTAVGNDYGYDSVFSRQVEGLGKKSDLLIAFSTSGNSQNIIEAINVGKQKGLNIITFTGNDGGKIRKLSDININVNSSNTPRIQEIHGFYIHILCELLEEILGK